MTNKTYEVIETLTGYTFIQATDENAKQYAIPTDPANSDYAEYLAFLESQPKKATAPKDPVVEEPVAPEEE
jgi:hypothetical protein